MSHSDDPSTQSPPAAAPEDPRELARRLAEEAKAKQLARQLVEQAKARATPPAEAKPPVIEQAKRSLAERTSKPVSVEDALRRAIADERNAPPKVEAIKPAARAAQPSASQPHPATAVTAGVVAPVAAQGVVPSPATPVKPVHLHDASEVITTRLPGAQVVRTVVVGHRVIFDALWQSHRARALAERNMTALVTADALLYASARVAPGALVAAHIIVDDVAWAVWLDASAPALLAIAPHPELLLAGL